MKRYFIIDASALVPYIIPISDEDRKIRASIAKLLRLRENSDNILLRIPNFCMSECSKAIAKINFESTKDYDKAQNKYSVHRQTLLEIVSHTKKGFILSLPLSRDHLENIEEIYAREYLLELRHGKSRFKKRLSGNDALIISMARHLSNNEKEAEWVRIVTDDQHLAEVCNSYEDFPRAIYISDDEIPG